MPSKSKLNPLSLNVLQLFFFVWLCILASMFFQCLFHYFLYPNYSPPQSLKTVKTEESSLSLPPVRSQRNRLCPRSFHANVISPRVYFALDITTMISCAPSVFIMEFLHSFQTFGSEWHLICPSELLAAIFVVGPTGRETKFPFLLWLGVHQGTMAGMWL